LKKICAFAIALVVGACAATAQVRPADKAQVRFVAAGNLAPDGYRAAIVIELAADTLTYWRNPGEAGVPPTFDWSASQNLATAEVSMPAPTRIKEAGGDVFGYMKRVAYAVRIEPADRGKPVRAALKMDYAACEKICIPMHAEAQAILAPDGKAGPDAAEVAAATALAPRKTPLDQVAAIAPIAGAPKPSWRVESKIKDAVDLFPEAPDGYFLETARDGAGFRLTLAERPNGRPPEVVPVRLTLTAPSGAVEFDVRLDAGAGRP
jgi:DsbC/DsbD-like thiol-disulfide interchange protein